MSCMDYLVGVRWLCAFGCQARVKRPLRRSRSLSARHHEATGGRGIKYRPPPTTPRTSSGSPFLPSAGYGQEYATHAFAKASTAHVSFELRPNHSHAAGRDEPIGGDEEETITFL
jgi:hypothetical protein